MILKRGKYRMFAKMVLKCYLFVYCLGISKATELHSAHFSEVKAKIDQSYQASMTELFELEF